MKRPRENERHWIPGAHALLALLAAAWLNLALQPCAAAAREAVRCPHCPPVSANQGPWHHTSAAGHLQQGKACASLGAGCTLAGPFSHDGRGSRARNASGAVPVAAVDAGLGWLRAPAASPVRLTDPARLQPGAASPLNVLYCVYLK